MHSTTVLAFAAPLVAISLCACASITDAVVRLLFMAAATFFSGFVMWLRSRYIAVLYLNELQARKQYFTDSMRRQLGNSGAAAVERAGGVQQHDGQSTKIDAKMSATASRPPRTVARLSPVPAAFMACCFILLSVLSTMTAALHSIWHVRSLETEEP
ncbi:hypothetical protein, unknown function [Leishmania tarentolae]|uniref:Uncharacterized protein n=1 Tax=Leishmania tarentolae TaxID=5689 RepID=A0A640KA18_LEITA|nr:hypothetical protein, unknown function [Leishmania tarentolae]